MNCQEAQPFVSALNDGETVPKEAAEHIRGCAGCRERLQDYGQMGVELRLVASTEPEGAPKPLAPLPAKHRRWTRRLSGRVLVPRFAVGLALLCIAALSLGLGLAHRQGSGPWFQFEASSSPGKSISGSIGGLLQAGEPASGGFLPGTDGKKIAFRVSAIEVRNDLVRLQIWERAFVPQAGGPESANQALADTRPRTYEYAPGQKLAVPTSGAGTVVLTGKVYHIRPSIRLWGGQSALPGPDELVIANSALIRDNTLLGKMGGGASAWSGNPAVGICVPPEGAFVFALKPFTGAVQAVAEYGQVRFDMDGHHYTLFSSLPVTGGPQPRNIWVYRVPHCASPSSVPHLIGSGDLSDVMKQIESSPTKGRK
ncbi:MAG TPA: hypothetical protein VFJ52_05715 [Terriglobia bacterium]|nr:hypothetical protein [Terriglobia bacterium]